MNKNKQKMKRAAKNNRTSKHLEKYQPPAQQLDSNEDQLIKDIVSKVKEELASNDSNDLYNFLQQDGKQVNIEFQNRSFDLNTFYESANTEENGLEAKRMTSQPVTDESDHDQTTDSEKGVKEELSEVDKSKEESDNEPKGK